VSAPGLSIEVADAVKQSYLEPADLKKIDIGGGMIHGNADDFSADTSTRLLLAHTSRDLTENERRIGSGAPFGTLDILISGQQNFLLREASEFLKSYFPTVPGERLHMLLNNRIVTFNPETIITPAGKVPTEIYLLLAGKVEMLMRDPGRSHFLFSGSLLAESAAIHNCESEETYRSVGFVQALRLPADLYRSFVERFFSSVELLRVRQIEERLRRTYLFSDAVTNIILFSLAKSCVITSLNVGDSFSADPQQLHLIANGRVAMGSSEAAQVLAKEEFWGFNSLFSNMADDVRVPAPISVVTAAPVALEASEIFSVPLNLVARIPVVRWKLFEAFRNAHPYAAPRYREVAR
jgi:hemerythrin